MPDATKYIDPATVGFLASSFLSPSSSFLAGAQPKLPGGAGGLVRVVA